MKDNESLIDHPEDLVDNVLEEIDIPDNPEVNPTQENTKVVESNNVEDSSHSNSISSMQKSSGKDHQKINYYKPLLPSKIYCRNN